MSLLAPSELALWAKTPKKRRQSFTDQEINERYARGEGRIVIETNREKLPGFVALLKQPNYMDVRPFYQRRPRWSPEKQSLLIESFIMNIPVPPVFLYEREYNSYEVMDGQQRITALRDFYGGDFELTGLTQWAEINGRTYQTLPDKLQAGLDRRSITSIVLLKESTSDEDEASTLRETVFERLNTGGVELTRQEIRNALYRGRMNNLLERLSRLPTFRSIWYILSARPKHAEVMNDGTTQEVPHILKDGSDSIGAPSAGLRVYINIGSCPDYRYSLEDTFTGVLRPLPLESDAKIPTAQHPFDIAKAQKDCVDWQLTSARIDNAANFLDALQPYPLKNAPGGQGFLTASPATLDLGKKAFAETCARCHSSKVPPEVAQGGLDKHSPAAKAAWVKLVMSPDFLDKNFLSDDDRYPLVSNDPRMAIGTNADRALGTNPQEGHKNPFDSRKPITYAIQNGGYYRTPSLINVWATAPFFHNNMLGTFTGDPSVQGRMTAFNDAAEKLLWPEKRTGKGTIKVTGTDSVLKIRDIQIRIPAGTPVDLLANINVYQAVQFPEVAAQLNRLLSDPQRLVRLVQILKNNGQYDSELKTIVPELLKMNQSPDFIQDHGHTFGAELPDNEKMALIEYMKTF